MAEKTILKKAKDYIYLIKKESGFKINKAYLYGSYAKNKARKESDIDVAIVSESLSGNRPKDWGILRPLARKIDWRIEPMPFTPKTFVDENPLVWEIKKTGKRIRI